MHALVGELVYTIPYHEGWYLQQYQGSNLGGKDYFLLLTSKRVIF